MKNGIVKIEKGIPLPPNGGWAGKPPTPLTTGLGLVKVGESFFLDGKKPGPVGSCISAWKRNHDKKAYKFAVRKENDGVRVWRVK